MCIRFWLNNTNEYTNVLQIQKNDNRSVSRGRQPAELCLIEPEAVVTFPSDNTRHGRWSFGFMLCSWDSTKTDVQGVKKVQRSHMQKKKYKDFF